MKQRRKTKQRQAILDCLKQAKTHLSADEVLLRVQEQIPSVNAATLYRNLHVLEEMHDVQSLSIGGKTFYETAGRPHHHFFCRGCERLISIEASALPAPTTASIQATAGFRAEQVSVLVEGRCALCSDVQEPAVSDACKTCPSLCQNVISEKHVSPIPCRHA